MAHTEGSVSANGAVPPASDDRPPPRLPLILRMIIILAVTLLIFMGVTRVNDALFGVEMSLTKHAANTLGTVILIPPMVLAVRRFLDRRPFSPLGFGVARFAGRDLLYGAITWLVPALLGLTVALSLGWLDIRLGSSVPEVLTAVLLLAVLVFLLEAFPEELIFRGYIHRNLLAALAPWLAVIVQALLFTTFGVVLWVISAGWGVLLERAAIFFAMGVVLGIIRHISGSLWAAIGFHLGFQVTMQLFLGGNYADIQISDESVFTLATAIVAFCTASLVAGGLWRGDQDWRHAVPDVPGLRT